MKLRINYQEFYSRGELLLRAFFGMIYIAIPHLFLLIFVSMWAGLLNFLTFWIILFTGRFPESFFDFQLKLLRWTNRLNASLYNLVDGYPAFGLSAESEDVDFDVKYPGEVSRSHVLVVGLFGWLFVMIPHVFILYFRLLWTAILSFLAFWVVLFTGRFPQSSHEFIVGTLRWSNRLSCYLRYMTTDYPPFTGRELPGEWPEDDEVQEIGVAPETPSLEG